MFSGTLWQPLGGVCVGRVRRMGVFYFSAWQRNGVANLGDLAWWCVGPWFELHFLFSCFSWLVRLWTMSCVFQTPLILISVYKVREEETEPHPILHAHKCALSLSLLPPPTRFSIFYDHWCKVKTLKAGLYLHRETTPSLPTPSPTFRSSAWGLTRAVQFATKTIGVVFSRGSTYWITMTLIDYLAF